MLRRLFQFIAPPQKRVNVAAWKPRKERAIATFPHAVRHHLSNIFDKVGVSTRGDLAMFAVNMRESEREQLARRDAYERELHHRGKERK